MSFFTSGPQVVEYTGVVAGGTGSTVAGDQHAPTAPGAPTAALASPKVTGNLRVGVSYKYKVTYASGTGETVGGTASGTVTPAAVTGTTGLTMFGSATTGGSVPPGDYNYCFTYVTASGETAFGGGNLGFVTVGGGNNRVNLTSIDTSADGRVTGRNLYRCNIGTAPYGGAVASDYQFVTLIANNSATTFTDNLADSSLGANPPTSNTATDGEQASLTSIPTSASSVVTKRYLYRSEDGGTVYKQIGQLNDNSTTTFTDNVVAGGSTAPAAAFGWAVPAANTTLGVVDLAQFPEGGWVRAGSQVIRYTARSASSGTGTLTGIPASGTGAIVAAIAAGNAVIVEPHLTGIPASGAGSILWPINAGDPVNIYVTRNDVMAQTALAAFLGTGDGIREAFIQDRRLTQTELEARCDALLESRKDARAEVTYQTQDVNTQAGATITVNLAAPTNVTGTFKIQQVTIAQFQASPQLTPKALPWRTVVASNERFSLEDLLRQRKLT